MLPASMLRLRPLASFSRKQATVGKDALVRIMALDIGKVRCGIAISDPQEKIATPLCVLPTEEVRAYAPSFRRVCEDW